MTTDEELPGEQLVSALENLRAKLIKSGVERTFGLRKAMGIECEYYWKSLNVFLKRDYKELKSLVDTAKHWFDRCEEENCEEGREGQARS